MYVISWNGQPSKKEWSQIQTYLITSPVVPLIEMTSPALKIWLLPLTVTVSLSSLTTISEHPHTHGFPHPLATTAACEVIPPLAVKIPDAVIYQLNRVYNQQLSANLKNVIMKRLQYELTCPHASNILRTSRFTSQNYVHSICFHRFSLLWTEHEPPNSCTW